MSLVLCAETVVANGEVFRPGWLEIHQTVVVAAGSGRPPRPADRDLGARLVVPGFIDMHVHGGGGGAFTDGVEGARMAVTGHRRHGTVKMVGSLVSAPPELLRRQVEDLAELVKSGELAGVHLEGPWLSHARCGAHDPATLRAPTREEIASLLEAGRGTIAMVTLAPELPGGIEAIRQLIDAGVVVAVGHTDATYSVTKRAVAAGASVGTHVFNAMRPIGHREPGPVIALAESEGVTLELIGDGVHLHDAVHPHLRRWIGSERIALVTDAMAAAGMGDGAYRLGALDVTVTGGAARVAETTTIAGSTATMDRLFARAIADSLGAEDESLLSAVNETSAVPGRVLQLGPRNLCAGAAADLVVLEAHGGTGHWPQPVGVMVAGTWFTEPTHAGSPLVPTRRMS